MLLSEKIEILEHLGLMKWLAEDENGENFRVFINGIAEYALGGTDYKQFVPSCDFEVLDTHFKQTEYDLDWYSLITGEFARDLEEHNTVSDIYQFGDGVERMFNYNYEAAKPWILSFAGEWCGNCFKALRSELEASV